MQNSQVAAACAHYRHAVAMTRDVFSVSCGAVEPLPGTDLGGFLRVLDAILPRSIYHHMMLM